MSKKNLAKKATPEKSPLQENFQAPSSEEVTATLEEIEKSPTPTEPGPRRLFWHKACEDIKKSTMSKIRPDESLTLTSHTLLIDGSSVPVLSLKRGRRIYYLHDVTPEELATAQAADLAKKSEKTAKEQARAAEATAKEKKK